MSLEQYSHKLRLLRGGEDPYSIKNWVPPGYNYEANTFEKHVPLNNYTGPGTWIQRRWAEKGQYGTNPVDNAARRHDVQYSNLGLLKARNRITQQELEKGIENADNRLLKVAGNNLYGVNPLTVASAAAAYSGIKLKRGLQDMSIIDKSAFTSTNANKKFIDEDIPRYLDDLPSDYLQGGKKKKKDRLFRLRKALKKSD
jgi:hypothetical protein